MANTFEIKIEDDDGAVASAQFYAYTTEAAANADDSWNGTGAATLTETQPITCDPHGEATIHHASAETLYIRVVNEDEVTGVRCVNNPLINTVTEKDPVVAADVIPIGDSAASYETKYATLEVLGDLLSPTNISGDNTINPTHAIVLTVSSSAASGGADGDIWIQVT